MVRTGTKKSQDSRGRDRERERELELEHDLGPRRLVTGAEFMQGDQMRECGIKLCWMIS